MHMLLPRTGDRGFPCSSNLESLLETIRSNSVQCVHGTNGMGSYLPRQRAVSHLDEPCPQRNLWRHRQTWLHPAAWQGPLPSWSASRTFPRGKLGYRFNITREEEGLRAGRTRMWRTLIDEAPLGLDSFSFSFPFPALPPVPLSADLLSCLSFPIFSNLLFSCIV